MRVKNKEIRQRRHRKEQIIKAAIKEAKKGGGDKTEKKAAPAADKAVAKKPAAPKKAAKPKAAKPAKKSAPPRLSALDAAAQVLAASDKPMRAQDLIDQMAAKGLWKSPGGKTPAATLYAAVLREIQAKKSEARFKKVERGLFVSTGKKS